MIKGISNPSSTCLKNLKSACLISYFILRGLEQERWSRFKLTMKLFTQTQGISEKVHKNKKRDSIFHRVCSAWYYDYSLDRR